MLEHSQIRVPHTCTGELPATLLGVEYFNTIRKTTITGTLLSVHGVEWEQIPPEGMEKVIVCHTVHVIGGNAKILDGVEGFYNTGMLRKYIPFHVPRSCDSE